MPPPRFPAGGPVLSLTLSRPLRGNVNQMQGLLLAGRYRLADSIGSGGMGRVWRAHDEVLHRAVAIKELTAALYVSEADQERLLARTRAEARAAARINHSAVVTVHDVLEHDGRPWIVMELIEGHSLADAVKERSRVAPEETARIGLWVLRALRAAHSAGVLHRDVKPGNVLLSQDGRVLLTDFGIAQIEGDNTITRTGEVVGSVDYLAPERIRGHDPGPSSDLWALGATLYTAVEGRSPFRRTSPLTTMQAVVEEEPAPPRHAGPLGDVITALLHKDPAVRPDAEAAELMLAEAAEGRRSSGAQVYVPTQHGVSQHGVAHHGAAHHETGAVHVPQSPDSGAPYPPATGPTTFAPPTGIGPVPPARPKRRRLRTLALVVVIAALVGGGGAVAYQKWDEARQTDSTSAPPSPSPTKSDGWVDVNDPLGFGLSLPKGWERKPYSDEGDLTQIDYTPDGGKHFVRIAIDTSPDFADPYQHQLDLEEQLKINGLVNYNRVTMEENTYRDHKGSLWEYTWTALKKDPPYVAGPRRAVEEMYIARDGTEYVIYMSSPAKDWATADKQFKRILQSWREPTRTP